MDINKGWLVLEGDLLNLNPLKEVTVASILYWYQDSWKLKDCLDYDWILMKKDYLGVLAKSSLS